MADINITDKYTYLESIYDILKDEKMNTLFDLIKFVNENKEFMIN